MEEKLEASLKHILSLYLKEFSKYMSKEKFDYLSDERNIKNIIKFSDKGLGAWCSCQNIMFGNDTSELIDTYIKSNPNYAKNPNIELVDSKNFIDNELDYLDYIKYFILKGGTALDYYLDMLPHEAMHLIGIGGGIIREGVCERNTRKTCLKYGIRCAPVLHSKENKLVCMLEQLVDKELIMRACFSNDVGPYDALFNAIR